MPKKQFKSRPSSSRRERRVSIRSELRAQPDLHKIAKAVVALVMAQAEKEAEEQAASASINSERPDGK